MCLLLLVYVHLCSASAFPSKHIIGNISVTKALVDYYYGCFT